MTRLREAPDMPAANAEAEPRPRSFGLRFILIAGVALCIYAFPFELFGLEQDWLTWYLKAYARVAGAALRVLDPSIVVNANVIYGAFPLEIVRTCDAAEVCILFASAVLAFAAPVRARAVALLIGLPCLVAANLLRICSLYFLGAHRPSWFKTGHEEVWPLVLVVFASFVFFRSVRFMQATRGPLAAVASD